MMAQIEKALRASLQVTSMELLDESWKHAGHKEAKAHGGSHYHLHIVANDFAGMPIIKRHRLIYRILSDYMKQSIHALSIEAKSPKEESLQ